MRPAPRTSLLALTFAVLALLAAGCGAGEVPADEVPGPPAALIVPSDSELGAAGSNADASADAGADAGAGEDAAAADDTADTDTSGTAAPTAPEDTSGGTTAPTTEAAPEDTTTDEQPPAAGSPPEQFESFCEQNAGAC
jgi:hypothetical protein